MEHFIDFIKGPVWEFLNSPFMGLLLVVVGLILFFVLFYKENKRINKLREEVQRQILEEHEKSRLSNEIDRKIFEECVKNKKKH